MKGTDTKTLLISNVLGSWAELFCPLTSQFYHHKGLCFKVFIAKANVSAGTFEMQLLHISADSH